ncbi:ABC transporter C family member 13-like protein [Drosera capensis]
MGFTHTPTHHHATPGHHRATNAQKSKSQKKKFKSDKAEAIDEFEVEKQRFLSSIPRFNNHSIIACGFESHLRIGNQNDEGDDDELPLPGNLVTLIMVAVIAISRRGVRWSGKKHLQEKILMRIFPALEVALLSFNMVMMRSNSGKGYVIEYYDWIFKCSRISVWKSSAEEEPLLHDVDLEDGLNDSQEIASSFCHCMTFNNIHPVLEQGVKKQLDFQDLLPLPPDMNPSLCHDTLRMSWEAQQITNCSNASLLKAIWSAYGWPYFCLGLLKVCNDCIGFAGPLLLNKLIRFLQKGGRSRDGIGLAISLGMVALLKSFLDTQYTYRLSKLKLRLRSSIMMMIYEKPSFANQHRSLSSVYSSTSSVTKNLF